MQTLYLIRGVPGSGKSSFAQTLLDSGVVSTMLEADNYFYVDGEYVFDASKLGYAHQNCQDWTKDYLKDGFSVAVLTHQQQKKKLQFTNRLQS